jgi:hypothetical protein
MSIGVFFWAASALLLLGLGFDLINSTGKVELELVALGLIPLGLIFSGWIVPINIGRREGG